MHAVLQRHRKARGWRRILRVAAGVGCVLLGVIGLFVPVLQGLMLLALGAALLAPDFPPARRLVVGAYRRWPRVRRRVPRVLRRFGRSSPAEESDESDENASGPP